MSDHYETRCPSCGGSDEQGCYADCPTHHITALEARVRELEEALNYITRIQTRAIMPWTHEIAADEYFRTLQCAKLTARAALNQEKQK